MESSSTLYDNKDDNNICKHVEDHHVLGDTNNTFSGSVLKATGIPHGPGRMVYDARTSNPGQQNEQHLSDVTLYDGNWCHGQWHGYGCISFRNGDCYVGPFDFGQRHGKGVYTWNDGRCYEGQFHHDVRHGHGTFTWPEGSTYVGEFNQGQRTGYGSYDFGNGNKYVGEWLNGIINGKGKFSYSDGRVYRGEWKNGEYDGVGMEYNTITGEIRHDGLWHHHQPVFGGRPVGQEEDPSSRQQEQEPASPPPERQEVASAIATATAVAAATAQANHRPINACLLDSSSHHGTINVRRPRDQTQSYFSNNENDIRAGQCSPTMSLQARGRWASLGDVSGVSTMPSSSSTAALCGSVIHERAVGQNEPQHEKENRVDSTINNVTQPPPSLLIRKPAQEASSSASHW